MTNTKILLLVSDPVVRSVIGEALEHAGYVVVPAGDLGWAADWLKKCPSDLLITRPFVSSMPGHEAAEYLRARCPAMRILIVGGFLDDDRLLHRESLAGFEVFPKPYADGPANRESERSLRTKALCNREPNDYCSCKLRSGRRPRRLFHFSDRNQHSALKRRFPQVFLKFTRRRVYCESEESQ
jgi:DNA-binding NtrC family response regulator